MNIIPKGHYVNMGTLGVITLEDSIMGPFKTKDDALYFVTKFVQEYQPVYYDMLFNFIQRYVERTSVKVPAGGKPIENAESDIETPPDENEESEIPQPAGRLGEE
jgi:hypothetical protein